VLPEEHSEHMGINEWLVCAGRATRPCGFQNRDAPKLTAQLRQQLKVERRACRIHTVVVETAAGRHLRHLAGRAQAPGANPLAEPARLQAVADAFVILGLLSVSEADEVLREATATLSARGLRDVRLGIRSEVADYGQLSQRGRDGLSWLPHAVAAGPLRLTSKSAEICVEWLRLSHAGLRLQVVATRAGPEMPPRHVALALADLSIADDTGTSYRMYWDGGTGNEAVWVGDVVGEPAPPQDVTWFELSAVGCAARLRIVVPAPLHLQVGTAAPPWPTAAESYLALLRESDPPTAVARSRGRDAAAAVAEALLCVGAIPADSPLLPRALGRVKRSRHPVLPTTWPSPVRRSTPPDMRLAICQALPFANAAAVVEGLSGWSRDIQVHLYGWPWTHSGRGPTPVPAFTVQAIDDLGGEHHGRPGRWRSYAAGESGGDFTFWPAMPAKVRRLRVVVSTLWEAAWADIDLPRGLP
jgi:hypothetical protein